MKTAINVFLAILFLFGYSTCFGQKAFSTVQKQAALITGTYDAAKAAGTEKATQELAFFQAFPSSFVQLMALYGYDESGDTTVYSPLYANVDHLKYFGALTAVPEREYFEKYIHIAMGGTWQADNISTFQHGLNVKVLANIKGFVEVLDTKKEKEIRGFFRFLFDGPHPDNAIALLNYQKISAKLQKLNPDMAVMLESEYRSLVRNSDGPVE